MRTSSMARWRWYVGDASPWPPPAGCPDLGLISAGDGFEAVPQACDQRTCVWHRVGPKVQQVSPTGRNGHHCSRRASAGRRGRSRGLTCCTGYTVSHHRKGTGSAVSPAPAREHGTGLRLLQWTLAKAAHGVLIFGSHPIMRTATWQVSLYGCPDVTLEGVVLVCVRFLRTQQRAKNRCQV